MSRTLSTVIVYYRARDALLRCLTALEEDAAGLDVETTVIDNHSQDGISEALRIAFPHVRVQVPALLNCDSLVVHAEFEAHSAFRPVERRSGCGKCSRSSHRYRPCASSINFPTSLRSFAIDFSSMYIMWPAS